MGIGVVFSSDESLRGSVNRARRDRLTELLQNIPAEVRDKKGNHVPVTILRVKRNIYWVEVLIPGYDAWDTDVYILDDQRAALELPTNSSFPHNYLTYEESVDNPKKHAAQSRHYTFVIKNRANRGLKLVS